MSRSIRNFQGFSLVDTLVSIAIMGVISSGFAVMFTNQSKQIKHLELKQESVDLRGTLIQHFKNRTNCLLAVSSGGPIEFDPQTLPTTPVRIQIERVINSGSVDLIRVNNSLTHNPSFLIQDITLEITSGIGSAYSSQLIVDLNSHQSSMMKILPVRISNLFLETVPSASDPNRRLITQCTTTEATALAGGNHTVLPRAGGSGGYPVILSCPGGTPPIGIFGGAAGALNRIGLVCQQSYTTLAAGGGGGGSFAIACPPQKVVSGFVGRSGGFVDQIQIHCSDPDGTNSAVESGVAGGGGGGSFNRLCPYRSVLVELRVRSGTMVDAIEPVCRSM